MILLALAFAAHADDASALIDRILEAHGGHEALDAVHGYQMKGDIHALADADTGTFTRRWSRPLDLDVDLVYTQRQERRILVGGKGWRTQPGGVQEAGGMLKDSMVLQAARAAIPWLLDDMREIAVTAEPATIGGQQHPGVRLPLGDTMGITVWADPGTWLVSRSNAVMTAMGMDIEFGVDYADHKPVEGVIFAFSEETFARGTPTSRMRIQTIVVNPEGQITPPATTGLPPGHP